jgi:hypothetical protein
MADQAGAGGTRIVKIGQAYAADANVPGVLMPFSANDLDLAGGTATVMVEKNGVLLITGSASGAGIEVYPGTDLTAGDIKTASGLSDGDILAVHYSPSAVRYAEIPAA